MTRALIEVPQVEGIAAGQTAIARLGNGWNFHKVFIYLNVDATPVDVAEANWGNYIENLKLVVDGDATIDLPISELVSLNKFYGHSHDNGVFTLFLDRKWNQTIQGQDQTIYKTGAGVESFNMELKIKSGVTINTLKVWAEVTEPFYPRDHPLEGQIMPWGPHLRIAKYSDTVGATGDFEYTSPIRGPYAALAMHIANGNVGDVSVTADGTEFHKSPATVRDQYHKLGGRVPQSGFTHLDFTPANRLADALGMNVRDFRIKANFTGTGQANLITEMLAGATMLAA